MKNAISLTATLAVFSRNVVGGSILHQAVGYVELAFATHIGRRTMSSGVAQP